MPKTMLKLVTKKPCLVGEKHRYPNEKPFTVEEDLFKNKNGDVVLPKHLKKVGSSEVSDAELKKEAKAKAKKEAKEKADLLKRAKDLGIQGAGDHWGLDALRSKVEEAELALQGGNE